MGEAWRSFRKLPGAAQGVVWVLVAFGVIGILGAIDGEDSQTTTTTKPAPKAAKPIEAAPPPDLTASDVVDLGDEEKFCRLYAQGLSAGASEDFLFGNFLRGYQTQEVPGAPPAREVFDEYVSRC